jgi:hypothetical protein
MVQLQDNLSSCRFSNEPLKDGHIYRPREMALGQQPQQVPDEAHDLQCGDRAMVVGLVGESQIYNYRAGTVVMVDDDSLLSLILDESVNGRSELRRIKPENLEWQSAQHKSGRMWKRGRVNKAFKTRFFVLKNNCLSYYHTEGDVNAIRSDRLGEMSCYGMRVENGEGHCRIQGKLCFEFSLTDVNARTLFLACETSTERDQWLRALRTACIQAKTEQKIQPDSNARTEIQTPTEPATECDDASETESEEVLFQGWVRKRGQRNSAFKKRYFVLLRVANHHLLR